jgi:MFS family permease
VSGRRAPDDLTNPIESPARPAAGPPATGSVFGFHGWRAFRHRNYRLFFGGQAISLVGTWMQQVAQGWLVLQLTRDPFALGLVAAAQFAPVLVFGLFGGLIADQLPKRRVLLVTQTVAMVLAFVLFGLTASGTVQVWHVLVLAVALGISNAVDMPVRQAFAVEMVGRDDVVNAVGLNSALFNASRILGPALAGLTIGAFDISIAFLINGVSFLAVIAGYLLMRDEDLRPAPRMDRPSSIQDVIDALAEGLRYVRATRIVFLAVSVVGLAATFGMNSSVLAPPLAQDVLHSDASGFGFLMAAAGVGSLVAALGVAFGARARPAAMAWGSILLGIAGIAIGVSRSFPLSLAAMLAMGFGMIAMAATANSTIQLTVPDRLRGRVMSVYTTVFAGSTPVGGLLLGAIASRFGVPIAYIAGGVITVGIGLWAAVWLRSMPASVIRPRRVPHPAGEASGLTVARPR